MDRPRESEYLFDLELYRLLIRVHPVFEVSLPNVSDAPLNLQSLSPHGPVPSISTALQDNVITDLRNQFHWLKMTFGKVSNLPVELSDKMHDEAVSSLETILYCFSDLLPDDDDDSTKYDSDNREENQHEFHKLFWAIGHADEAQCLISFTAKSFSSKRFIAAAIVFTNFVERLEASTQSSSKGSTSYAKEDDESSLPSLPNALRLSEKVRQLFAALEKTSCGAGTEHKGYLRLVDDLEKTTIDMLMSVCGKHKSWQQAYFHLHHQKKAAGLKGTVCGELRNTQRRRKDMNLALSEADGGPAFVNVSIDSERNLAKSCLPPDKSLRSILDESYLSQEAAGGTKLQASKDLKSLPRLTRSTLGVHIVATMICLFASPMFRQHTWDMDCIHILQNGADITLKSPTPPSYLSFGIAPTDFGIIPMGNGGDGQTADLTAFLKERHIRAEDGDHLLLALIISLLELESGKKIELSDDDFDDELGAESLYHAALRQFDDESFNLEIPVREAITKCLDIYDESSNMEEAGYCREIQTALFKKVFVPLFFRHKQYWKSMGKLSDLSKIESSHLHHPTPPEIYPTRAKKSGILSTVHEYEYAEKFQPEVCLLDHTTPKTATLLQASKQAHESANWMRKVDNMNIHVSKIFASQPTTPKVRIAILDTGCNLKAMCIANLYLSIPELRRRWKDWVSGSPEPVDEDTGQHGTATAALLLRVAKHAEIYIGRVIKDTDGLGSTQGAIAEAISHAVNVWNVDVISMSFGFKDSDVSSIKSAIEDATVARARNDGGILFFGAANNQGLNEKELFPANHRDVIAIRGTDHTGKFMPEYNCDPYADKVGELKFGTLATEVPFDCLDPASWKSGCSMATPIFAGIVATIIQYMDCCGDKSDPTGILRKAIRKREGIIQVIKHLTDRPSEMRYVRPWSFFELTEDRRIALVTTAIGALPS